MRSLRAYEHGFMKLHEASARDGPSISFSVPPEDRMLIAASGDGLSSSEDEDSPGLLQMS